MKKIIWALLMLPLLAAAQDGGKKFSLAGKINHLPDSSKVDWVYLQYRVSGTAKIDSVQPVNGKYSFKGTIAEPVQARLRVKFAAGQNGKRPALNQNRDLVTVFLEPGNQKIVSTDSFSSIKVKGSKAHSIYADLTKQAKPYTDKMPALYAKYSAYGKAKDKEAQGKVEEEIDAVDKEMNDVVYGSYAKNNPSSPLALYALQQYAGWEIDADKAGPVYEGLSDNVKKYPSAVSFKEKLEIAKLTGIGKTAMEFTQNDTLDQPVALSSLRGKYVLVDFWASWCGPCRAENPAVVKVFNKYKDRNFHIIGVSLDRPGQKDKWLKAIHDDGLAWTQVSDLKFWDNEVAKQYGIQAIPQNLLLDPDGKIIGKNLRGDELEEKLSVAIEGKKAF